MRNRLDCIVHRKADDDDRDHRRQGTRRPDPVQSVRPEPPFRADHPDQREEQPDEGEEQVGEGAQEEQNEGRDEDKRQPDQRQHPRLRRVLVLILDHHRGYAAHPQRTLVPNRELVDPTLGLFDLRFIGVAQPDGGDGERRAVDVGCGHRPECPPNRGITAGGIDLPLRYRLEAVNLKRGLEHQRRGDNCLAGRQQVRLVAGDAIDKGIHLGESLGREGIAAKDEGDDGDVARIAEKLVDLIRCFDNAVVGRKERQGGAFDNLCAPSCPRSEDNGNEQEDGDRDPGADGDQPAQPVEDTVHGPPF